MNMKHLESCKNVNFQCLDILHRKFSLSKWMSQSIKLIQTSGLLTPSSFNRKDGVYSLGSTVEKKEGKEKEEKEEKTRDGEFSCILGRFLAFWWGV